MTMTPHVLNPALPPTRLDARADSSAHTTRRARPPQTGPNGTNPAGHLTSADVEAIGLELDALRAEVMASRGESDARYIRRVIAAQRGLEAASRAVLLFSGVRVRIAGRQVRPAWWIGTAGLSVAKILENMEIGHNVMHGQWDWMRDPRIHSTAWEWDNASPSRQWKRAHNGIHHTFTNVLERDNDLGYGILRVDRDQPWSPFYLMQPALHLANAALFEYSIAAYDLDLRDRLLAWKALTPAQKAEFQRDAVEVLHKMRRQATKDYLAHPALAAATGSARTTFSANLIANLVRNVWTNTVIICGHFPEGISTFTTDSIEGESRGEWYLRQMLGSGNISGSPAMHLLTGNLSHQIEHHLFPDLPSNRYAQIAPRIRALMARYDLPYVTGSLPRQVASVYTKVFTLSLPDPEPGRSRGAIVAQALRRSMTERRARRRSRTLDG